MFDAFKFNVCEMWSCPCGMFLKYNLSLQTISQSKLKSFSVGMMNAGLKKPSKSKQDVEEKKKVWVLLYLSFWYLLFCNWRSSYHDLSIRLSLYGFPKLKHERIIHLIEWLMSSSRLFMQPFLGLTLSQSRSYYYPFPPYGTLDSDSLFYSSENLPLEAAFRKGDLKAKHPIPYTLSVEIVIPTSSIWEELIRYM